MKKQSSGHGKSLILGIVLLLLAAAGAVLIGFSKEIFPQNMFGGAAKTVLIAFSAATLTGSMVSFKNAVIKKRNSINNK
jgi:hypothetical protein